MKGITMWRGTPIGCGIAGLLLAGLAAMAGENARPADPAAERVARSVIAAAAAAAPEARSITTYLGGDVGAAQQAFSTMRSAHQPASTAQATSMPTASIGNNVDVFV